MKWEREVGLTNQKNDKGGLTNDGITYSTYLSLCKKVLNVEPTKKHFEALTIQDVYVFYNYIWYILRCSDIESVPVAACVFDFGVNSDGAEKQIQRMLIGYGYKKVIADGVMGPVTVRAINAAEWMLGAEKVCLDILSVRQRYVESLVVKDKKQADFIKGWTNRINDLRKFVLSIIQKG